MSVGPAAQCRCVPVNSDVMPQGSRTYPEVELGFYLMGELPDSVELEHLFNIRASTTHRSGEPRLSVTGHQTGIYRGSEWGFTSRHIPSNELDDHVRWLLSVAGPARKFLGTKPNVSALIELALVGNSSTVLECGLIQFAHELKARIGIVVRRSDAA